MANEVHDIILVGNSIISESPTSTDNITNKGYVDSRAGFVSIDSVAPTSLGAVAGLVYSNSIPTNMSISKAQSNTTDIDISFTLSLYDNILNPSMLIVTSTGATSVTLTSIGDRKYSGQASITISNSETISIGCVDNGVSTQLFIDYVPVGPSVNSVAIGVYPNGQTELKELDVLPIVGTVHNGAVDVSIIADSTATSLTNLVLGPIDGISPGLRQFSADIIVGPGVGVLPIQVIAINATQDVGPVFLSPIISLNQTTPVITVVSVQYPVGKTGLQGGEQVIIEASVSMYDTLTYWASPNLTLSSPTVYTPIKSLTASAGVIESGTVNYSITATKTSNGAVALQEFSIEISDIAPTATVTFVGSPAFMLSSPTGEHYPLELLADQNLASPPSVTASSGLILNNNWVQQSNGVWTNTIVIIDGLPKGPQTLTATLTGSSGLVGTTLVGANYIIKGFTARDLVIPPFAREIAIGTFVSDITRVSAVVKGSATPLVLQNNTNNTSGGFTITDGTGTYSATGSFIYINDSIIASSNSSGTMLITIQEPAV